MFALGVKIVFKVAVSAACAGVSRTSPGVTPPGAAEGVPNDEGTTPLIRTELFTVESVASLLSPNARIGLTNCEPDFRVAA